MIERTTHESWMSRLAGSIKGVVVGGLLFVIAFPLLFLNEGRAVRTAKGLAEGAGAVVNVKADTVDQANDGKFVHLSGLAESDKVLSDNDFAVNVTGIRLERHVEMYQWVETTETVRKKKLGGGTKKVTRYDYEKKWSTKLVDSSAFEQTNGHQNPTVMPFSEVTQQSAHVTLGAFELPEAIVSQIQKAEPVELTMEQLPSAIADRSRLVSDAPNGGSRAYVAATGQPADNPQVGDVRVWFTACPSTDISVMSKQVGSTFEPFHTSAGTELNLVAMGTVSPDSMIADAEAANTAMTWMLRLVGLAMAVGGIALVLRPMSVMGDVIPLVGTVAEFGILLVAGVIGGGLTLCTISVAWLFYRPLIGLPLLIVGVTGIVLLVRRAKAVKAVQGSTVSHGTEPKAYDDIKVVETVV